MLGCCSSDDDCKACTGGAGKVDALSCFTGEADDEDEVVTSRVPQQPCMPQLWLEEAPPGGLLIIPSKAPPPYAAIVQSHDVPDADGWHYPGEGGFTENASQETTDTAPQAQAQRRDPWVESPADLKGEFGQKVENVKAPKQLAVAPTQNQPMSLPIAANEDQKRLDTEAKAQRGCCNLGDGRQVLDEKAVLQEAAWCLYCCCGGCGCGQAVHPRLQYKCMCCRQTCDTMLCWGPTSGCCGCIFSLATCHLLCQCPPPSGAPPCVCCGSFCCNGQRRMLESRTEGGDSSPTGGGKEGGVPDLLLNGVWTMYCCCFGCTHGQGQAKACVESVVKCCCCNFVCDSDMPCNDEGCISALLTCWTVYCQCRLPPSWELNPLCACCGKRYKHHGPTNHAPTMQQMS